MKSSPVRVRVTGHLAEGGPTSKALPRGLFVEVQV